MIHCRMQRVAVPSVLMWHKYPRKNIAIGLEVKADSTQYMVMSRDQIAGRSHSIQIDNSILKVWKISNIWEQR